MDKYLTSHPSLDAFKSEKADLLRPHVALIKGGTKPIIAYSALGDFTAHKQGSAAFVDLGGTPHGGVVVEYNFTSGNRLLGHGRIYSGLESLYLDGQLYDIDNLVLNIDERGSASASGSGALYKSIEMPASVATGKHTVEFVMGDALFYEGWLGETTKTAVTVPAQNSVTTHANGVEFVDLGLPSGRLWAKCNVGANQPSEYGLYFQWADTKGYPNASQKRFDWPAPYAQSINNLQKYTGNDGLDELEVADDAARANLGGMWLMPSKHDFIELKKYCTWRQDHSWYEVVGPNGNSIILPRAGYCSGMSVYETSNGYYWSRSHYALAHGASNLTLYNGSVRPATWGYRCNGYSVRGVL